MSKVVKSKRDGRKRSGLGSAIRSELSLIIGAVTATIFLWFGSRLLETVEHPGVMGVVFVWLFLAVLWLAISVVRHADRLAIKCGEPYGTLILTLSAISIEVMMISAAMLQSLLLLRFRRLSCSPNDSTPQPPNVSTSCVSL